MPFLTNDPLPQCLQTSSDIALSPPIGNRRGCGRYLLKVKCLTCGRVRRWSRTRMPHARGVAPAEHDPPETRRLGAANDEDGRAPRTAADGRPAGGDLLYAPISTPSGSSPVRAYSQSAISSLRAMATIAIRRVRPARAPPRPRNQPARALPGW